MATYPSHTLPLAVVCNGHVTQCTPKFLEHAGSHALLSVQTEVGGSLISGGTHKNFEIHSMLCA